MELWSEWPRLNWSETASLPKTGQRALATWQNAKETKMNIDGRSNEAIHALRYTPIVAGYRGQFHSWRQVEVKTKTVKTSSRKSRKCDALGRIGRSFIHRPAANTACSKKTWMKAHVLAQWNMSFLEGNHYYLLPYHWHQSRRILKVI